MDHAADVLSAVQEYFDDDLSYYSDSISSAFQLTEPVFTRERYAEFFWHCASTVPGWIAQVVLANSKAESDGSAKLLHLWETVNYNQEVEDRILSHARDESRHSRLFLDLAQRAFPRLIDAATVEHMNATLPDVRNQEHKKAGRQIPEDLLIDHLIQMNIGEIRTRIHMQLLSPVIHAFTPQEDKAKMASMLKGLVVDEVRHIGYTAKLMEKWACSGEADRIGNLYRQRLQEFHLITIQQTEAAVRDFGQGRFPDLLEI